MRRFVPLFLAMAAVAQGQEGPFKAEALDRPLPDSVGAAVREGFEAKGTKIVDEAGKTYAEVWFRKTIKGKSKPAGPQGAILCPSIAEGELVALVNFPEEASDYRENSVPAGAYSLRYGLLPENGAHLGVSEYRDYGLLVPVASDSDPKPVPIAELLKASAKTTGTKHPGVLLFAPPSEPAPAYGAVSMVHDEAKATWGLSTALKVEASGETSPMPVRLVIVGAAME